MQTDGPAVRPDVATATGIDAADPTRVGRILLATDLGGASDLATDWAFAFAQAHGANLLVISVIDGSGDGPEATSSSSLARPRWDQVRDRRQASAQHLVERGRRAGIDTRAIVWTGDAGESIVAAAEAEDVDLVIVGTHGRGRIGRLLLGSVSEHVARNAPCPVLVVRPQRVAPRPDGAPSSVPA